jgi:hypothetical protein
MLRKHWELPRESGSGWPPETADFWWEPAIFLLSFQRKSKLNEVK